MENLRKELIDFSFWLNANHMERLVDYLDEENVDEYLKSINSKQEENKICKHQNAVGICHSPNIKNKYCIHAYNQNNCEFYEENK